MIIYTKDLSAINFEVLVNNPERLLEQVVALVPQWAKCVPHIVDNQIYFCVCHLRNLVTIPFKKRKEAIERLCEDVTLGGLANTCIMLQEVLEECDMSKLRILVEDFYEQSYT